MKPILTLTKRRFAELDTDDGDADADVAPVRDGVLAALFLDQTTAQAIAIEGGEPADELHITLAFAPHGMAMDDVTLANALVNVQNAVMWAEGLTGVISGFGIFNADANDPTSKRVFYASVDVPGLSDLASEIQDAMVWAGLPPSDIHDFVPHVTLKYLEPDEAQPADAVPTTPLRFRELVWLVGDRQSVLPIGAYGWSFFSEGGGAKLSVVAGQEHKQFVYVNKQKQFVELVNGELPNDGWINILPTPGVYMHAEWGELAITPEMNREFVDNCNNHVYQNDIPVDAQHDSKLSGAYGWFSTMRLNADYSADAQVKLTPRGRTILSQDGFRYVSPEWWDEWQQPDTGTWYSNVICGLAFTNNPFFKERYGALKPIVSATENGVSRLYVPQRKAASEGTAPSFTFSEAPPAAAKETRMGAENKDAETQADKPVTLSAEDAKAFAEFQKAKTAGVDPVAFAEQTRIAGELKATVEAQAEQIKTLKEERLAEAKKATEAEITAKVTKAFGGTAPVDHVQALLNTASAFGPESEQMETALKVMRSAAEIEKQGGRNRVFSEHGSDRIPAGGGSTDAGDAALTAAEEAFQAEIDEAKKFGEEINRNEAMSRAFASDERLYRKYSKAMRVDQQKAREEDEDDDE